MNLSVDQEEDHTKFQESDKFQEGNQWLSVYDGLKGSPLEDGAMANGHYSDSLTRKLDRMLNDREHSDVEDAENISVQGNLELQLSKLLDDTEDEISSNAWSAGSSSSSVEHLSPRDFIGVGMFPGVSNSNLELSNNPVQPLGVELAAALDSSSQHSGDSEETVGEEDGSVLCVYNNAVDLKNGWIGSDNESDSGKADENKEKRHRKSSSVMYPSSSTSDSDSDEICIKNPQPPKQYAVVMSSDSGNTLQSNEAENGHSTDMPNLPVEPQPSISQETTETVPPVEHSHVCESTVTSLQTEAPTEQGQPELPLANSTPTSVSPISTPPLDQRTTTDTPPPPSPAKPSTASHNASINEEGDVKSGISEDSQENELELIKLQLQEVLARQTKMMESFRLERKQLRLDNYKQRKIITKLQRERKTDHCKLQNVVRHANMRVESVEEKMVALVEQCAILKEHIIALDTEFQNSPIRISPLQSPSETVASPPAAEAINHHKGKKLTKAFSTGMVTKHKVKKLQKFFGESPPLLQMFLEKLGYEQYLSYFERERIGLVELPHITEEQLIQLGIPMGPRQRIIDEAAKL